MAELWIAWITLFLLVLFGLIGAGVVVGAILWWSTILTRRKSRQIKGATQRHMERMS
jgi:hypothetical protein